MPDSYTATATATALAKADFSSLYQRPDPRQLYETLAPLDYRIPQSAAPFINDVHRGGTILDVCCSYGVGAAQLRYGMSIADLADRYRAPAVAQLDTSQLITADRAFYATQTPRRTVRVVGLDASGPALRYATDTGLMADGWAEDLEASDPSAALAAGLADVTTLTCTGGIGYIGAATFRRLLATHPCPGRLRAVLFVLRTYDYTDILEVFADHGLVAQRFPGVTFPQRRFVNKAEQESVLNALDAKGISTVGKEAAGWFHAECLVIRPAGEAPLHPLR